MNTVKRKKYQYKKVKMYIDFNAVATNTGDMLELFFNTSTSPLDTLALGQNFLHTWFMINKKLTYAVKIASTGKVFQFFFCYAYGRRDETFMLTSIQFIIASCRLSQTPGAT